MEKLINLYEIWCGIDEKIRFLFIGGINTVISYAIFFLATMIFGQEHYQLCVTLQWSVSSIFSYFNQKFFVFCTTGNYLQEYLKCCSTWVVSYFMNVIILEILVRYVYHSPRIDQIVSIFLVSIITYVLFKYFAFKK